MLAKINVPANAEEGLVATTAEAARGDDREESDSDSGASFHKSHTQAEMTAYKKASARTIVDVTDGTILPIDGLGTVKVDLEQPDTTTKPVNMVSVAYVPERSWNLLSTRKVVEQWGKPLVDYETKAVLGLPGDESLIFSLCPRKRLFSVTGVRRTPSQGAALGLAAKRAEATRIEATGQWGPYADVRRSSSQGAALALAAKTAESMKRVTGQWGPCADVRRSPIQGTALEVAGKCAM